MTITIHNDIVDFEIVENYVFINSVNSIPSWGIDYNTLIKIKESVLKYLKLNGMIV